MTDPENVDLSQLRPGPIRHESLPPKLLEMVKAVYDVIGQYLGMTLEQFEIGFMRDMHPERELAIWCSITKAWLFANMPVGTPHSFKNESSHPAKMLISVAPAGLEQMFFEVGVPLADGATTALPPTKAEIEKLLEVAPRYGIEIRLPGH